MVALSTNGVAAMWSITNFAPCAKCRFSKLVVQSREALLVEWLPKHHVHENLNPDTGLGDDVSSSNPMYHWGALLGFLEMWEHGKF